MGKSRRRRFALSFVRKVDKKGFLYDSEIAALFQLLTRSPQLNHIHDEDQLQKVLEQESYVVGVPTGVSTFAADSALKEIRLLFQSNCMILHAGLEPSFIFSGQCIHVHFFPQGSFRTTSGRRVWRPPRLPVDQPQTLTFAFALNL